MPQLLPKTLIVVMLAVSAWYSLNLLILYFQAVTGRLVGAGAAQWQFAFFYAPVPAVLGLLCLAVAFLVRPRLSKTFVLASLLAAALPAAQ